MSNQLTLRAQTRCTIRCFRVGTAYEVVDRNQVVGRQRFPPPVNFTQAMVTLQQKSNFALDVQLLNPDASLYAGLPGSLSIRCGFYQKAPVTVQVALVTGAPVGNPSDGLVRFELTPTQTDFDGYLRGEIEVITADGDVDKFEKFPVKIEQSDLP